ncbi:alpha-mannosidase [Nakamurella flava]|uniref:Alpha-mannosidase n=1 Tax=Nakamurella flava TaxID=2576308 RepID=A0A4U6QPN1_9ACTN|nr:glycoside hydrolase family 38 C-terminal domain-containing protein [Nakamurella flava]TKV62026.1 alpha-mannosidase [Nakamurella flava]
MHQNIKLVEERVARVLTERIVPAVYSARVPVTLRAWAVPDEPVPPAKALAAEYTPFAVGDKWGRAWSTWWFEITGEVPAGWAGRTVELVVDPGFQGDWPGNQAEGLIFTPDGTTVKGIHPRNQYVRIADEAAGTEKIHFFLEAAANPDILVNDFVPTKFGSKETAPTTPIYTFRTADLAVFEPEVWALRFDIEVLYQLLKELPETEPRRHEVLRALERALNVLLLDDIVGTAAAARAELEDVLARPASASAHRLSAIGHAHIDTAWLWPLRETKRKTGRTFSNVLELFKQYPDFRFACSSAQQYAWVKERYPHVWQGIKDAIATGQWIVVGSQWIEPDGNLPGGEAMVRQVTQGLRFFRDELDVETHGIWLPDSFGYNASFPQIARLAGLDWFLTQKISWNQTNTFPHHTFWWEGIDGSRIFTHFPPADTYNSTLEGEELHHAVRQFRDKGKATTSLIPFGYGDGGGGPIREMMERQHRTASLEGSPRVIMEHPDDFFARAQAEYADAPVWVGELYLELHRGTFTSHAREKRGNRAAEHRLREAELWWTAAALNGASYPYEQLDRLWQGTLLQQFHDILPGSSIAWVHQENEQEYAANLTELEKVIGEALAAAGADGLVVNSADHDRRSVVFSEDDRPLGLVDVPAHGAAALRPLDPTHPVTGVAGDDGGAVLANGLVTVRVDDRGLITSIHDETADRELVPAGRVANLLQLHQDLPNAWDAWDIDAHYRNTVTDLVQADAVELVETGPLRALVRVTRSFGKLGSTLTQTIAVHADSPVVHLAVDLQWQENEKLLKASLPFVVHAQHHSAEIQFGHLRRPTHTNTSWDDARFEVMAHRWVHVEEPGYGIGVANAGTYGHDITRQVGDSGEVQTEVRLSLVRAARSPDPTQDLGHHTFAYVVHPGAALTDIVATGYETNLPLRVLGGVTDNPAVHGDAVATSDNPGVRIEAVKLADDRSGDVVVRMYEALGRRASTTLHLGFGVAEAIQVDLMERPLSDAGRLARSFAVDGSSVTVGLRPFQVVTVRLRRTGQA